MSVRVLPVLRFLSELTVRSCGCRVEDPLPVAVAVRRLSSCRTVRSDDRRSEGCVALPESRVEELDPRAEELEPRFEGLDPRAEELEPRFDGLVPLADGLEPLLEGLEPLAEEEDPLVDLVSGFVLVCPVRGAACLLPLVELCDALLERFEDDLEALPEEDSELLEFEERLAVPPLRDRCCGCEAEDLLFEEDLVLVPALDVER